MLLLFVSSYRPSEFCTARVPDPKKLQSAVNNKGLTYRSFPTELSHEIYEHTNALYVVFHSFKKSNIPPPAPLRTAIPFKKLYFLNLLYCFCALHLKW